MSAASLNNDLLEMLNNGLATVPDPGASATIRSDGQALVICEVVTAGAEGRTLESATLYPVWATVVVVLKTAVGALTITGAASGTEVLSAAGDMAIFRCTNNNGTKEWRYAGNGQLDALEDRVAALEADAQQSFVVDIPIPRWRIWNSLDTQLSATAASADDLAHIVGTYGTDSPYLTTVSTTPGDANPVVQYARYMLQVPENYTAGSTLTFRVAWARPDAAATSMTLDAEVFRVDAPTVDICATAAASINAAASGTTDFTITPTNVVPGETLNIRVAITAVSNGASYEGRITKTSIVYAVAG